MKSNTDKDALGSRMKGYENAIQLSLPRRTYTILRIDGRAFHTWTHGLARPYDIDLMRIMDVAALTLCDEIPGAQFAFVQSDEISLLAVDFKDIKTQSWFDGNIQKWASVGASIATMAFNLEVMKLNRQMLELRTPDSMIARKKAPNATFDARVYVIPDFIEVENYFVWRQKDAVRNSVTMLAQAYASHKQLHGKSVPERHEIIHTAGDNWAKHPVSFKHGRVVRRANENEDWTEVSNRHSNWIVDESTPVFTKDRNYLRNLIPIAWENDALVRKAAV